jgi:GNAT superfamily N-acetyltransferase
MTHGPLDARLRPFRADDARWVVRRHVDLYARDEGFDVRFEAAVARLVAGHVSEPHAHDRGWIAEGDEGRRGCLFCMHEDDETARLRLFLVEPEVRGAGLGRRLLDAALAHARATGHARLVVSTYDSHRAACRLYTAAGFARRAGRPVQAYGRDLLEVAFTKPLR